MNMLFLSALDLLNPGSYLPSFPVPLKPHFLQCQGEPLHLIISWYRFTPKNVSAAVSEGLIVALAVGAQVYLFYWCY